MSYSVVKMKNVPTGEIYCLKKTSGGWVSQVSYSDCVFVPSSNYPDFSQIQLTTTSTGWFYDYDEFVPKSEKLFLDLLFVVGIFVFVWFLLKFVFKILFK